MNICPKCGNEIEDGHVYCNKCGYEIQIVPDFDAALETVIDNNITGLLQGIDFDEISDEQSIEKAKTKDMSAFDDNSDEIHSDQETKDPVKKPAGKKKNYFLPVLFTGLILIIIISGAYIGYHYYTDSDEYIIKKAENYEKNMEYEKAIECYRLLLSDSPEDAQLQMKLAANLWEIGNTEEADEILKLLITKSNDSKAYDMLLSAYAARKDYTSLNTLLKQCDIDAIREKYQEYMVKSPVCYPESGSYPEDIEVKLENDLPGTIYYTLDGTEPDTSSIEYNKPIKLGAGKHVVRAVFVNERGILSESVSGIYDLQECLPKEPVIQPEAGEYKSAEYITVEQIEGCQIYYTLNDTLPDENSSLYEQPLIMQQGHSTYRFVAIDEAGRRSNISTATYDLSLNAAFDESQALNYLITFLTASGRLTDIDGSSYDGKHKYECIGIISSQGADYYMVSEIFADTGAQINIYGVNAMSGSVYNATRNEEGYFVLSAF